MPNRFREFEPRTVNVASGGTLNATNLNMGYVNYGYQRLGHDQYQRRCECDNLQGVASAAMVAARLPHRQCECRRTTQCHDLRFLPVRGPSGYHQAISISTAARWPTSPARILPSTARRPSTLTGTNTLAVSAANSATISGTLTGSGGLYVDRRRHSELQRQRQQHYSGCDFNAFTRRPDTLNFSSTGSQTINSLAGVAGSQFNLAAGTLTTGGDNTNTAFAGNLSIAGQRRAGEKRQRHVHPERHQ